MANEKTNDTGYGCNMNDRTLSKTKGAWKTLLVMRKFMNRYHLQEHIGYHRLTN